jgi:hypothetical protein
MPKKAKYSHCQVIEKLGSMCAVCKCRDIQILQVDHPLGNGNVERRMKGQQQAIYRRIMEGYHQEYRALCANCNWRNRIKSNEGGRPRREVTDESMSDFLTELKRNLERLLN